MHVAILGSGKIGATLARRFTQTGHEVTIANSLGPDSLGPYGVPLTLAQASGEA